jgi:hypothetical protein
MLKSLLKELCPAYNGRGLKEQTPLPGFSAEIC